MKKPISLPQPTFEDVARQLGRDEDPARFDEAPRKVARQKPPPEPPKGKKEAKPGR
jgi:hypothetical protein